MFFSEQHIFGVAPGVDFPKALVEGLCSEYQNQPPEALARVHVILNTERMLRRVQSLFFQKPGILHPRLHLVTDLKDFSQAFVPELPLTKLTSRFELIELVEKLIIEQPELASRASLYSLAGSLADLIDEMAGEDVNADAIFSLDVSDQSGHWERAKRFISIAQKYLKDREATPDSTFLQRRSIIKLITAWKTKPLLDPVIVAGSTGSRGTTLMLMKAVVQLPQGVLLLPGFDFDLPQSAWEQLQHPTLAEDHPQARFVKLLRETEIPFHDVERWKDTKPPCPERNALISLALRPAPVTDSWFLEGPKLHSLELATEDITLLQAPDGRREALSIALRLREAVERGETAALISPDRLLTRQVTAALDRWGITPDDSGGLPLHLSVGGRFLRHVAGLLSQTMTAGSLLAIMKHPLTHSGGKRNIHLLFVREFELFLREEQLLFPEASHVYQWASKRSEVEAMRWAAWVCNAFFNKYQKQKKRFQKYFEEHQVLTAQISNGHDPECDSNYGKLWDGKEGAEIKKTWDLIHTSAHRGGLMTGKDFAEIFRGVLADGEVRDPITPHPNILIWGTLEARVHGADIVILGGLNEGNWPKSPDPDPWLNRTLRNRLGLFLPERKIGLSAHDFQQAIAVKKVWLTRALQARDSQTVPSRWLNRLINLLCGLKLQNGPEFLRCMENRGNDYLLLAECLEKVTKTPPAQRYSPRPPVSTRPKQLSVTEIKTLIRDPYSIYAKYILRLGALEPLNMTASPRLRGEVAHKVFERFVTQWHSYSPDKRKLELLTILDEELSKRVPWSLQRICWRRRIEVLSDDFLEAEAERQQHFVDNKFEQKGKITLPEHNLSIVARADRIHVKKDGTLSIYDYKTGAIPTQVQQNLFDKQLGLMVAIAEKGGFDDILPCSVSEAAFIALAATCVSYPISLEEETAEEFWVKFKALIARYQQIDQGYTPRRALFKVGDFSDYDQLSRYGEWEITQNPTAEYLV